MANWPYGGSDGEELDDMTAPEVRFLDELHAVGRTLVVITHDAEVAAVAERTIRIRDGLLAPVSELA